VKARNEFTSFGIIGYPGGLMIGVFSLHVFFDGQVL
jgi:hypothetical protein